jgi:hypothetical protein
LESELELDSESELEPCFLLSRELIVKIVLVDDLLLLQGLHGLEDDLLDVLHLVEVL